MLKVGPLTGAFLFVRVARSHLSDRAPHGPPTIADALVEAGPSWSITASPARSILTAPVYRTAPHAVLPGLLRNPGDGSLVENIKWSEVSKRFGA